MHRHLIAALAVASVGFLSAAANAQDPVPLKRSVNPPVVLDGQQASVVDPSAAPASPGSMQAIGYTADAPKDRFGNKIRGDKCEDHWANCAFDPANPVPPPMRARQE